MCGRFTDRLNWHEIGALYRLTVPATPERKLNRVFRRRLSCQGLVTATVPAELAPLSRLPIARKRVGYSSAE